MGPYLFIDGAYLRARLEYIARIFSTDPLDFNYRTFSAAINAEKAFYYDCLPAKSVTENSEAYEKRVEPNRKFISRLRALPGYHVFLGEAIKSGGTTRQKGVDIRIAVDMLTHSFRRNINRALLFAGDRDFEPLVSALVREGIYVAIGYHPRSVAQELLDAADDRLEYDTPKLWNLATPQFQKRFPAPQVAFTSGRDGLSVPDGLVLRTGTFETEEVRLYKGPNLCQLYLPRVDDYGNKRYEFIYHPDENVIMKLLKERHIVVSWH